MGRWLWKDGQDAVLAWPCSACLRASRGPLLGLSNTAYHCPAVNGSGYRHLAQIYTCASNRVPTSEAHGSSDAQSAVPTERSLCWGWG